MKSHFINPYGFDDRERRVSYGFDRWGCRLFPATLYHVKARKKDPVTWVDSDGFGWTFNKDFWSNRGSVPSPIHWLCEPDTFLLSFYCHDSACMFKGLFKSKVAIRVDDGSMIQIVPCAENVFTPLTRLQCDEMLRQWVLDEGGTQWQADGIYCGVRAGARLGIGGNWGVGDLRSKLI